MKVQKSAQSVTPELNGWESHDRAHIYDSKPQVINDIIPRPHLFSGVITA